jgi:tetratricopeptide (TPR) repeat protein
VARAAKGRAAGPEAHRLFLLGRHLIDRANPDDTALAIDQLEEAVRLEPDYALAWAELGGACANLANYGTTSGEGLWTRARTAVERSLVLEPDLAEGHARLGWLRLYHDWDWIGARTSLARALELSPRDSAALLAMGTLLYSMGRYEESVEMGRRAVEHDPLNARAHHILGIRLRNLGRDGEAEQEFRAALALVPQRAYTRGSLGLSLAALGRTEEALAEVSREPAAPMRFWALAQIGHALGRAAESDAALEELIAQHSDTAAYQVAEVCAARGQIDRAFEWLERARVQQDPGLIGTLGSPPLRTLHGDPRWREFLKAMKLDNSPTG